MYPNFCASTENENSDKNTKNNDFLMLNDCKTVRNLSIGKLTFNYR